MSVQDFSKGGLIAGRATEAAVKHNDSVTSKQVIIPPQFDENSEIDAEKDLHNNKPITQPPNIERKVEMTEASMQINAKTPESFGTVSQKEVATGQQIVS